MHDVQPRPDGGSSGDPASLEEASIGALRLRGGPRRTRQRVAWNVDVVDNEGAGKKKSKSMCNGLSLKCGKLMIYFNPSVCCIYHKPKRFDESSDEDSSDSDSDSDHHSHTHSHHRHGHGHEAQGAERSLPEVGGVVHELEDESGPNAYERDPGSKKGKRTAN